MAEVSTHITVADEFQTLAGVPIPPEMRISEPRLTGTAYIAVVGLARVAAVPVTEYTAAASK